VAVPTMASFGCACEMAAWEEFIQTRGMFTSEIKMIFTIIFLMTIKYAYVKFYQSLRSAQKSEP
jgi:hypothetical protein